MSLGAGDICRPQRWRKKFGQVSAMDTVINADGTVFSVNVQTGSMGVNVFEGDVTASAGDGAENCRSRKSDFHCWDRDDFSRPFHCISQRIQYNSGHGNI